MKTKKVDYKKELDKWFSVFIRMRDKGICFTCGKELYWKAQQNGHYISRSCLALRFDEINCNCQCVGCNIFKHGNMPSYALALVRKHGAKILEKLEKRSREITKLDKDWYIAKIEYYKKQIKKLENTL